MCEFRLFVCFAFALPLPDFALYANCQSKAVSLLGQARPDANQPLLSASFMYFGLAQSYGAII